MDKEHAALVKRLRESCNCDIHNPCAAQDECLDALQAADAIEALAADNAAQAEMVKAQHRLIEELQARAEAAEAKLEAVARRALGAAGKEAEDRFTEYEGCGVYVYGSSVSDAIRAIDPAAIVREVMEAGA